MKKEENIIDPLVVEHAKLVAQLSKKRGIDDANILERLKEIEEKLGMSSEEIASIVIQNYKNQY